MSKILIAGDFAPTISNEKIIAEGNIENVLGEALATLFQKSYFVCVNLETSLADKETPKLKRGQINRAVTAVASFFPRANIKMCFLANNHIIDNGNEGVISTVEALDRNGVLHIGAGMTREDANKCFFLDCGNKRIGFFNVANYEFNKITKKEYGANTYDPLVTFDEIEAASRKCDFLIVIYHGGLEYYRYPTPELQRICRKMVEKGAKLVTCQHSHCIGTYEQYNDATIVYGQGNFLFDDSDKEEEKTAILIELDTDDGKATFVPVVKQNSVVRMAESSECNKIFEEIELRHREITEPDKIEELFKNYCKEHQHEPLRALTGYNTVYRIINKLTKGKFRDYIYNKKNRMRIYNMLETPVHLEVLQGVMKQYEDQK